MIKFCVEQWDKNKNLLKDDIRKNVDFYLEASYEELVKKVVDIIFNENSEYEYNSERITVIDDGNYQGTLVFMIPEDISQPSHYEYLMTYVRYGSCSVCDTLSNTQYKYESSETSEEQFVSDIMNLCLHIVQNTIKPYNDGLFKEKFEVLEVDDF